jgi:hypothetical protein
VAVDERLEVGDGAAAPDDGPHNAATLRWLGRAAFLLAGVVLFEAYFRLSQTVAINSDGGSNALQAWDMLHGNVLLHGWSLSDTSFYTTDLPQYMIVEAVHGLGPDVVHAAAALTYTLIVLVAVALARGRTRGAEAAVRMLVTAGILIAPLPPRFSNGADVLLSSADHVGTVLPVLAAWLVLDRAGRRWWVPLVTGLLLAWALTGDTLALYTGILPLLLAGAGHAYHKVIVKREPAGAAGWEIALAASAAGAVSVAWLAVRLIHDFGGFSVWGPNAVLVNVLSLPSRAWSLVEAVTLLFGADYYGAHPGPATAIAVVHLAGLCLAGWAVLTVARRWRSADLIAQLLAIGIAINLLAYLAVVNFFGAREIAAVLPFCAVLAGRQLGGRLVKARLVPLAAVLLFGYVVALLAGLLQPAVPADNQQLTTWLAAHHFRYGLAGYWEASVTTVTSGNRVQVRPVSCVGHDIMPYHWASKPWETEASWYSPRLHDATFLVTGPGPPGEASFAPRDRAVPDTFGAPVHIYDVGPYQVQVFGHNLLADLR